MIGQCSTPHPGCTTCSASWYSKFCQGNTNLGTVTLSALVCATMDPWQARNLQGLTCPRPARLAILADQNCRLQSSGQLLMHANTSPQAGEDSKWPSQARRHAADQCCQAKGACSPRRCWANDLFYTTGTVLLRRRNGSQERTQTLDTTRSPACVI